MKLVLLVTAKVEQGMLVAQAWQDVGVSGVTIVRTHGLRTLQQSVREGAVELPLIVTSIAAAMAEVLRTLEELGEMLLSVVDDTMVDKLEQATTDVLGDMRKPYNGFMIVIDVERAIGIYHYTEQT